VSAGNVNAVKYCSKSCMHEAQSVELTCCQCGVTFRRPRSQAEGVTSYCTAACTGRAPLARTQPEPAAIHGCKWIPLGKGRFALVDESDFTMLDARSWRALAGKTTTYAVASSRSRKLGTTAALLMHRVIMGASQDKQVDHINQNGLDNRRSNLRVVAPSGNYANSRARRHGASMFKGVHKSGERWESSFTFDGRKARLGRFDSEIEAAIAFDAAAREVYGEAWQVQLPERVRTNSIASIDAVVL
jgi:hypothetical protein